VLCRVSDVRVVFSKWGDRPHWELDAIRLGEDEHGVWIGAPAGTRMARPGVEFIPDYDQVALVPHAGCFEATFNAPTAPCEVYVDITTRPVWDGGTLRMIDLDLDVIRGWSGRVWVDDEDEFADHRVRFGYPDEIIALAVESCDHVRAKVESGAAPYDGVTGRRWLAHLSQVIMES
jgi:hypothetical protein